MVRMPMLEVESRCAEVQLPDNQTELYERRKSSSFHVIAAGQCSRKALDIPTNFSVHHLEAVSVNAEQGRNQEGLMPCHFSAYTNRSKISQANANS